MASVEPTPPTVPARKPRRRHTSYLRSGLYRTQPPTLPDASTPVGAILAERRASLIADLGGDPSTAQRALVDLAVRQWALLDSVDGYVLTLPSLVDRRHRRCWQVVADRSRLAAQLEATLCRLGLDRRAVKVADLEAYLAAKPTTP
jgi:hypothetical protein